MKNSTIVSASVLLVIVSTNFVAAGPPQTSPDTTWYNPATWSLPAPPWSSEPSRLRKKSPGLLTEMNQSARRGWAQTKSVLDPSKMFIAAPKPSPPKPTTKSSGSGGFWGRLFGTAPAANEIRTTDDFLRQPRP